MFRDDAQNRLDQVAVRLQTIDGLVVADAPASPTELKHLSAPTGPDSTLRLSLHRISAMRHGHELFGFRLVEVRQRCLVDQEDILVAAWELGPRPGSLEHVLCACCLTECDETCDWPGVRLLMVTWPRAVDALTRSYRAMHQRLCASAQFASA